MKSDSEFQPEIHVRHRWAPSAKIRHAATDFKDSADAVLFAKNTGARRAARRAASVEGTVLENHRRAQSANQGNDDQISQDIARLLEQTTGVRPEAVQIKVESGWVTLSGELDWNFQKVKIIAAIHYMPGVDGLSDEVTIKPHGRLMLHQWGQGNVLDAPRQTKQVLIGMLDTLEQGLLTEQAATSDAQRGTSEAHGAVDQSRGVS